MKTSGTTGTTEATGATGMPGTTGMRTTGTTGGLSNSTNAGPHDSNFANKLDPRVDSDLDGRGNRHGATTGGVFGASGSHATPGRGTAQNTAGPHNVSYESTRLKSSYCLRPLLTNLFLSLIWPTSSILASTLIWMEVAPLVLTELMHKSSP